MTPRSLNLTKPLRRKMQRALQNLLSRATRAPVFRAPQARNMSALPGKEQINAASARASEEVASLGASLGESVQKLQWWTNAKVFALPSFTPQCLNSAMLSVLNSLGTNLNASISAQIA